MDIENIGPKLVDQLIKSSLIKKFSDIYYINKNDLMNLERMGEKSADNIISSINRSKENQLSKFLFGLGIRHIGQRTAKLIAKKFYNIDMLINAKEEELLEIEEIGDKIAKSFVTFFSQQQNIDEIKRFKEAGLLLKEENISNSQKLNDLIFVLTGTLPNLKRNDVKKLIEDNGGKVSGSVSKKTSYVIVGEEPGSKLSDAKKLDIKTIDEEEFLNMLK